MLSYSFRSQGWYQNPDNSTDSNMLYFSSKVFCWNNTKETSIFLNHPEIVLCTSCNTWFLKWVQSEAACRFLSTWAYNHRYYWHISTETVSNKVNKATVFSKRDREIQKQTVRSFVSSSFSKLLFRTMVLESQWMALMLVGSKWLFFMILSITRWAWFSTDSFDLWIEIYFCTFLV